MNTKRLQKSLNQALDAQLAVLIHNACERRVVSHDQAISELHNGIANLLEIEQAARALLGLPE